MTEEERGFFPFEKKNIPLPSALLAHPRILKMQII